MQVFIEHQTLYERRLINVANITHIMVRDDRNDIVIFISDDTFIEIKGICDDAHEIFTILLDTLIGIPNTSHAYDVTDNDSPSDFRKIIVK